MLLTKLLQTIEHVPQHQSHSLSGGAATTHPLLGVLAVLLGALLSVFTGQLLTIGLADVTGAVGANSDSMSWVPTVFNAANMFIGPLTVYLGGLLGARRVLFWAS